jgi:hypothetical protein
MEIWDWQEVESLVSRVILDDYTDAESHCYTLAAAVSLLARAVLELRAKMGGEA